VSQSEELQLLSPPQDFELPCSSLRSLLTLDASAGEDPFVKKTFQKHGWEMAVVQGNVGHLPENVRATALFNQKEVMLRPKGSVIIENY